MRSVLPLEQAVLAHRKTAADEWHSFRHVRPNPYEVYTSLGSDVLRAGAGLAFLHQAMTGKVPFRREEFIRQLNELPGDWPPPEETGG
jgi:hypothetical protein